MAVTGRGGISVRGATLFAAALTMGAAPPVETVEVKTPRAKVEADDGTGLFVIGQDNYVFAKVGNPKRQIIVYDPVKRRVRISALDRDPMWIQCGYLEPSKNACPAPAPAAVASPRPTASPSAVATAKPPLSAGDQLIADLTGEGADQSASATPAPATKGFRLARPNAAAPAARSARPAAAAPMRRGGTGSVAPAALPDCPGDPRCP